MLTAKKEITVRAMIPNYHSMLTTKKDITVKAMILNYHYHCVFHHDLDAIRSHKQFGEWWDEMDNTNRAYVLKGKFRRQ